MKNVSISAAKKCHILAPAVLRQLGGGTDAIDKAIDAANHGADSGFTGFTYCVDTIAFAKHHRKAIAASLLDLASDCGTDPLDLVRGFGCFRHDKPDALAVAAALTGGKHADVDTVYNALAWYALEDVGGAIIRLTED